jgi:sec-independent protein translocase protein TatA
MELIIVLIVALVVLGPKKLPEMGRSLGQGLRGFRETIGGKDTSEDRERIGA